MKKISGNKLLVKALKEEGVDTLFGSLLRGYFHKPFMKTYTTRLLS